MADVPDPAARIVQAVHGLREVVSDPSCESTFAAGFRERYSRAALLELYGRFAQGEGDFDGLMRRVVWLAIARAVGDAAGRTRGREAACVEAALGTNPDRSPLAEDDRDRVIAQLREAVAAT